VRAQGWPIKPIRLIVPLTPGSATDLMAGLVMEQVSAQIGQPIIVENRPGAGNTIGMGAVAKSDPDGYTILVQALAVSGSKRASALPDVPTTVEAGFPNSEYNFWAGIFAPARTATDIRTKLHAEISKALAHPRVRDKLRALGADSMPLTSEQYAALVQQEIEINTQLVKAAGIKVN
jgi:tripartite-type tricarboxylate transporter receptor subunit TctC